MTKYREILRLSSLGLSQQNIATSCGVSKKTVNRVLKRANELNIHWPLGPNDTDAVLASRLFPPSHREVPARPMPNFELIRKELMHNGVSKKLLWMEYVEDCKKCSQKPLMYSQFCYHIQQDEQKRRASMHIKRNPAEQIEVDWAGDTATFINPETGKPVKAYVFVGVLSYSKYAYAEAFLDMKQKSWINAHVHMYEFFGGVSKILISDNCKTAVVRSGNWNEQCINRSYQEMAEHYGTAIIPARVRAPKDKPNAEGAVGNISTWIIAALRKEQFFSLHELNKAIRQRLILFNQRPFQKREGSRESIFLGEEKPYLAPLPATRFELCEWKLATVQFNYHISIEGMLYSVPYEYIKKKVSVRVTDRLIEIFSNHERIASHMRLYGPAGQYSTVAEHMPKDHQEYLQWNGERFRSWASRIGVNTHIVVSKILSSNKIEQQGYRSCMGLLQLANKHSAELLEAACQKALTFSSSPSYKNIKNILVTRKNELLPNEKAVKACIPHGITRGADYYRR